MRSPEEWGDAYAEVEWRYQRFAERLEELFRNLLQDDQLDYISSSWSSMSVDDFVERIYIQERGDATVEDPFIRFGDLAAVTIVARTKDYAEPICALVEREFELDDELSLSFIACETSNADIAAGGYPERIYYDFPRLVVSLSPERWALPEWQPFADMKAEIRVQTLLQRAWEEVDDHLAYVWDSSYARRARDAIIRVASLVAEADDELARVDGETREAERHAREAIEEGDLSSELDAPALWVYVMESPTVTRLLDAGVAAGLRPWERSVDEWELEQIMLWVLRRAKLRTLQDLDGLLESSEGRASEILGSIAELGSDDEFVPSSAPASVVTWVVLVLTRADADTIASTGFRSSIERALNTLIGNPLER